MWNSGALLHTRCGRVQIRYGIMTSNVLLTSLCKWVIRMCSSTHVFWLGCFAPGSKPCLSCNQTPYCAGIESSFA